MSNFSCEVTYPTITGGSENKETDLEYVYNKDKEGTNLIPYTTNIVKNTTDLGTLFKNQYNSTSSLTTKYNTTIEYVNLNSSGLYTQSILNSGVSVNNTAWGSPSISSTGQYCLALGSNGNPTNPNTLIYYSHDYGITFTASNATSQVPFNVCISGSGQYGLSINNNKNNPLIFYSDDYGVTWNSSSFSSVGYILFYYSCLSYTGQYGLICESSSVYYSSDYGNIWTLSSLPETTTFFNSISNSSCGKYAITAGYGFIYYSNDYGVTWNISTITPPSTGYNPQFGEDGLYFNSCSMSSTGQYCIACTIFEKVSWYIYYSSDYGQSWYNSENTQGNWWSVSISSTGQYGIATTENAGYQIYYSSDYGVTWPLYNDYNIDGIYSYVSLSSTGKYALLTSNQYTGSPGSSVFEVGYLGNIVFSTTPTIVDLSTILQPINPAYWTPAPGTSGSGSETIGWTSVSISNTGQYGIACVDYGGSIYYSSDYGNTWAPASGTSVSETISWTSVSISSTGQYGLACVSDGSIYYSSDYGINWTISSSPPGFFYWTSVSISSTGQYGIAGNYTGSIYYSSDYGNTWTLGTSGSGSETNGWTSVSISSTGQYGIACIENTITPIYYSNDYGINWTISNSLTGLYWTSVSISSTGQYGLACNNSGSIYYSSDYGFNWALATFTSGSVSYGLNFKSVSISRTGQFGLACVENTVSPTPNANGIIYYSSDFGQTWSQAANTSGLNWYSVSISSTGQYGLACINSGSIYYLNG